MNIQFFRLIILILSGLIAGTLFGIWAGYNPKGLSVQTYVEQQQGVIRALNTLMPLMGLITILITVAVAFMLKEHQATFVILLLAAGLLIVSGLITKLGNQPINAIVITWEKSNAPTNWTELRDRWWSLHTIRMLTAVMAFGLIAWSSIRK